MLWVIQKCKYEKQQEVWRREREGGELQGQKLLLQRDKQDYYGVWLIHQKQTMSPLLTVIFTWTGQ